MRCFRCMFPWSVTSHYSGIEVILCNDCKYAIVYEWLCEQPAAIKKEAQ